MLIFYLARLVLSVLTKGLTSGLLEDRVKAWVCGSLIKILAEWFRLPIHCFPFTLLKKKKKFCPLNFNHPEPWFQPTSQVDNQNLQQLLSLAKNKPILRFYFSFSDLKSSEFLRV